MKLYVIHLERAKARFSRAQALARDLGQDGDIVDAIDGILLSDADRARFRPAQHIPTYPFVLRDSEIACFLSHRKVWRRIANDRLDGALVAEDDILLDRDALEIALECCKAYLDADHMIRFPVQTRERAKRVLVKSGALRLIESRHIGLGMHLSYIGKNVAKQLLEVTESFDRPVDTLLQMPWVTGIQPLALCGLDVDEDDEAVGGSMIRGNTSITERLHREIARPIYRWKLYQHAKRVALTPPQV